MANGMHHHIAIICREVIASEIVGAQLLGPIKSLGQIRRGRINVLIQTRAQKGDQPTPIGEVGGSIDPVIQPIGTAQLHKNFLIRETL